jgi:hypothetical protein
VLFFCLLGCFRPTHCRLLLFLQLIQQLIDRFAALRQRGHERLVLLLLGLLCRTRLGLPFQAARLALLRAELFRLGGLVLRCQQPLPRGLRLFQLGFALGQRRFPLRQLRLRLRDQLGAGSCVATTSLSLLCSFFYPLA